MMAEKKERLLSIHQPTQDFAKRVPREFRLKIIEWMIQDKINGFQINFLTSKPR